jgi:hypothetical protein
VEESHPRPRVTKRDAGAISNDTPERSFDSVTTTIDLPMSADPLDQLDSGPSEEAMYVAVTRAWFRQVPLEERVQHPLGPYLLARQFVPSMIEATVDIWTAASICAALACRYPWERDSGESKPLPGTPVASDDPLSTWWFALPGTDALGVHYDELGDGTLVFLLVGGWDERPLRGFERA